MKTLNYLPLNTFDGKPIKDQNEKELDFKEVLLAHIGGFPSKNGGEAIKAFALGQKIYQNKEASIDLEDAELELLKKILEERPGFSALVMGQIFKAIEESNKQKE